MLEQAVYAGRNHKSILAGGLIAAALLVQPAQASDVAHVSLGSSIEDLIAGPDGGAWVRIQRRSGAALGRAFPDGRFITAGVDDSVEDAGGALGPDGQAWFTAGLRQLVRMDAAGQVTIVGIPERGDTIDDDLATGPDGTLWVTTVLDETIAHVTPQGAVSYTRTSIPRCTERPQLTAMARASDGVMWIADPACDRLLRVTPGGAWSAVRLADEPVDKLAADAAGGVWFAAHGDVGHVTGAGNVTRLPLPDPGDEASDVAVAPDGSAWFAVGRCRLGHATPAGLTFEPIAVPARHVAFDPAGGFWLASGARLVHTTQLGGACDDRPPAARVTPSRRVSVAALRRGLRITVGEPVAIDAVAFYRGPGDKFDVGDNLETVVGRAGSVRYRIPRQILRRFARGAGRKIELTLFASVTDREGNTNPVQVSLRVAS